MNEFGKNPLPAFTGLDDALPMKGGISTVRKPKKRVRVKKKGSWLPKFSSKKKKKKKEPNCVNDENIRVGGSAVKTLSINCEGCRHGSDLKDPECRFRCVNLVGKHLCDKLVLDDGYYKKEYQEGDVRKLGEIYRLGGEVKMGFPEECGECAREHERQMGRIREHLQRDPIGLLNRGVEVSENTEMTVRGVEEGVCNACRGRAEDLVSRVFLRLQETKIAGGYEFTPLVRPFFSNSRVLMEVPPKESIVSRYNVSGAGVMISRDGEEVYSLFPPEYGLGRKHLEVMKGAYARMVRTPCLDENGFQDRCREELAGESMRRGYDFPAADVERMADSLTRCTTGLDVLELLLKDVKLQDVYINSPIDNTPLYVKHEDFDDCRTNIYLSEETARNIISKFRLKSGRAFSEVSPVLDMELPEFGVRVNITGPPISPDGLAFAFRRASDEPWTLLRFIENRMISPLAAGLLGTMVNEESTVLVGGDRGSGKTSLLVALVGAMSTKYRILTMEDTFEIPVPALEREANFRIQRMRIRPSTATDTFEMSANDAMRGLLRMGDSAIVMGEVRGEEAKTLYEAMNVGGSGNCVLGTIHGKSPRSLFERIVYSLGVPPQSFKATDLVVMADRIRPGGGKRVRRVTRIVEVKKSWSGTDPEEVFSTLMVYDRGADALVATDVMERPEESETIRKIASRRGMEPSRVLEEIRARGAAYEYMVALYEKNGNRGLLSTRSLAELHRVFDGLADESISGRGRIDYGFVLDGVKSWADGFSGGNADGVRQKNKPGFGYESLEAGVGDGDFV